MKLPMKILLYSGDHYLGGDWEEAEALALKAVVKKFFYPVRGPFVAWLFYETQTGHGHALAVGGFVPKPGARQKMHRKGLGIAPVPTQFQQTLLDFGPQGLRWDGAHIVANGN
jgi:hypothetical protein